MKPVIFVAVSVLLLVPLASLQGSQSDQQTSCTTEGVLLQQEAAELNAAIAQYNLDCGQVPPEDAAKRQCAQRGQKLNEWSNAYNKKLEAHNARCEK